VAKQSKLPPILNALWGVAQVAARKKVSQKEFNDAIRAGAAAQGIDLSHISGAGYQQLRSSAVKVRNGIQNYHNAPNDAPMTHDMLPATFFSRPLNERNLVSEVQTSIAMTYIDNGVQKTDFFNVSLTDFQFTTKGAFEAAIALEAQLLARNYGYEYKDHYVTEIKQV
jgi:hypothetical protein